MAVGSLAGIVAFIVAWPFGIRAGALVTRGMGKFYCRAGGIRITIHGLPDARKPVLYVCNHVSYLDIIVIASVLPATFVSKADVVDWPLIGLMARLNDTILIDRKARGARAQCATLRRHLQSGHSLILFPEGTSGDGNRMLPFRSSLFDVAAATHDNAPIWVQPMSLAYTRLNGCPVARWQRPYFAWYGDMPLAGHLWRVLGLGRTGVDLIFHAPVRLADFPSRKALASHCEREVARGVATALAGRTGRLSESAAAAPDRVRAVASPG